MFNNAAYSVSARFRCDSTIIIAQWKYNSELSCFTFVGHFSHLGRPPALHKHQVDPRHAVSRRYFFCVTHMCWPFGVLPTKKWMLGIPAPGVRHTFNFPSPDTPGINVIYYKVPPNAYDKSQPRGQKVSQLYLLLLAVGVFEYARINVRLEMFMAVGFHSCAGWMGKFIKIHWRREKTQKSQ